MNFCKIFFSLFLIILFLMPTQATTDNSSILDESRIQELLSTMPDGSIDPEAYHDWKIEYSRALADEDPDAVEGFARTLETMVLSSDNGYVDVNMGEAGDGNGTFEQGADPAGGSSFVKLTFDYPSVPWSFSIYKIDGNTPEQQYRTGPDCVAIPNPDATYMVGDSIMCVWNNRYGVKIVQILEPVSLGGTPGNLEQIMYTTLFIPVDGFCHQCGCLVYYDTMLDGEDGCPISTSFGYTGNAEIFYAPGTPSIWRAYEFAFPPAAGDLQALGILTGFQAVMPDVFWYGNWGASFGNGWDDSYWAADAGGTFGFDTATMVKWYHDTPRAYVCTGETLRYVTYYGIGDFEGTGLVLTHNPPTITAVCENVSPNPAPLTAMVTNNGTANATNINVILDLSGSVLNYIGGDANPSFYGTIAGYGGTQVTTWNVDIPPSAYGTTQCYTITVTYDGGGPIVENYCINIPVPYDAPTPIVSADDYTLCAGECTYLHADPNTGTGPVCDGFSTNFDSDDGGFVGTGSWQWGNPSSGPGSAHTAPNCWATNLSGDYSDDANWTLTSPDIDLTDCSDATLTFWHWYETEYSWFMGYAYDGGNVKISTDGGSSWSLITPNGGYPVYASGSTSGIAGEDCYGDATGGWVQATFNLAGYVGGNIRLRWHFGSDGSVSSYPGWYIDDVDVSGGGGTGPAWSWFWTPATGLDDPNSIDPHACPTVTTMYTFTVTDGGDCTGNNSVTITVYDSPIVTLNDDTICYGDNVILTPSISGSYSTIQWSTGATTTSITVSPTSTTQYWVEACDGSCCGRDTCTVTVSPEITLECGPTPAEVCEGSSINLSATPTGGIAPYSYSWTPAGGSSQNPIVTPGSSQWYYCTVTDDAGCDAEDSVFVEVLPVPETPALISIFNGAADIPPGDTCLYWHDQDDVVYYVYFDGGLVASAITDTYWCTTLACDESHTWYISAENSCGTEDSETWSFTTMTSPSGLNLISPANGASDVPPGTVTLDWSDASGSSPIYYNLYVNGSAVATGLSSTQFDITIDCDDTIQWYVEAYNDCGTITSATWVFYGETSPDGITLSSPADGADEIPAGDVDLIWNPPTSGSSPFEYDVYVNGSPVATGLTSTSYTIVVGCDDTIDWFVVVSNICGADTSDTWTFYSETGPEGITLVSPPDGTEDVLAGDVDLTWNPPTSGSEPFEYDVYVDGVPVATGLSSTIYTIVVGCDDTLEWFVVATNICGSDTSDTWTFYTQTSPNGITLVSPPDGTEDVLAGNVDLTWNAPTEGFGPFTYDVYVDGSPVATGLTGLSYTIVVGCDDTIEWFVVVSNICGPDTSDTWIFYTQTAPDGITLVSPLDGTSDIPAGNVDLTWNTPTEGFGPFTYDVYVDGSTVATGLTGLSYTIVVGCDDTLEWFVVVSNICGPDTSDTWSFSTQTSPDGITLQSPADSTDGVPAGDVVLIWNPPTSGSEPFEYDVYVDGSAVATGLSGTNFTITVECDDTLEWFVVATNSCGDDTSETWLFTTQTSPEGIHLIYPPDDSAGIYPGDLELVWSSPESGDEPFTYSLYIDGMLEASGLSDTTYHYMVSCGETHTWFVIVENICGEDTSEIWVFSTQDCGFPMAVLIEPFEGAWSACEDQNIIIYIYDPAGIEGNSIRLSVLGDEYDTTDLHLSYVNDTLYFVPDPLWLDGDSVWFCLDSAANTFGITVDAFCSWFRVDLTPPVASGFVPASGEVIAEVSPIISISVSDSLSGLLESNLLVTVSHFSGTDSFYIGDFATTWADPDFSISLPDLGIVFSPGEEIEVCVFATDNPDYCPPNILDTCWIFSIVSDAPVATLITPEIGVILSCEAQQIVFEILSELGVDSSTITLAVEGDTMGVTDPRVFWLPDTLYFIPFPNWSDGDTVEWSLIAADDWLGDSLANPLEGWFVVDLTPPVVFDFYPPDGDTVAVAVPGIYVIIADSIAGVDTSSIALTVDGTPVTYTIYDSTFEDINYWNIGYDGTFSHNDTVEICISSYDLVDASYCAPNSMEFCWSFEVDLVGPVAWDFIDPATMTPLDGLISACSDQGFCFALADTEVSHDVNPSTIVVSVNGTNYDISDTELSFADSQVCFDPSTDFADGEVVEVIIVSAEDNVGNPIGGSYSWSYIIDLSPPYVPPGAWPGDGAEIATTEPVITFTLDDVLAGVNESSVEICISISGGAPVCFDISDAGFDTSGGFWNADFATMGIILAGGDEIEFCVTASDTPDLCPPNILDTCWTFSIPLGGPRADLLEPFEGAYSACDDQSIIIRLADLDGVVESTILLSVNGTHFTTSDGELEFFALSDSLVFTPTILWLDGETVVCSLITAEDIYGNTLEDAPRVWTFFIDLAPPVVSSITPVPGSFVGTTCPIITFDIEDFGSGLNADSTKISIDDGTGPIALVIAPIPSTGVNFVGSTVTIDVCAAGLSPSGGDEICVSLNAIDSPDYCPPNVLDSLWCFTVEAGGPVASLVCPDIIDACTGCDPQPFQILIEDTNGVVGSTIILDVDGVEYDISDAEMTWVESTLTFDGGTGFFPDGSTNTVELIAANDMLGNELSVPVIFSFTTDYAPPEVSETNPLEGSVIDDTSPFMWMLWFDPGCADIDFSSFSVNVNGTDYPLSSTAVWWSDDTLFFDSDSVSLTFEGGDTVNLCQSGQDLPDDICGDFCPNDTTICIEFYIARGGPIATPVEPLPDEYSACIDQQIIISLIDTNGVDESTIVLEVNGVAFTSTDIELEFDAAESLLIFTPTGGTWTTGSGLVTVDLIAADDLAGNELEMPLHYSFILDFDPPYFFDEYPLDASIAFELSPVIGVRVADDLSGLDPSTIWIEINGDYYDIASPFVSLVDDTIQFDTPGAGYVWSGGDIITICAGAGDTPDYCAANEDTFCWTFTIASGGPIAAIVEPFDSSVSTCIDQQIIMTITDPEGVNSSTIVLEVDGISYIVDGDTLTYVGTTLTFDPGDSYWPSSGVVTVSLISADDMLGNSLEGAPVSWIFTLDFDPPLFGNEYPIGDVYNWQAQIGISVWDSILGVNPDSFVILLDGIFGASGTVSLNYFDDGVEFDGMTLTVAPDLTDEAALGIDYSWCEDSQLVAGIYFPEMETIRVTIEAQDNIPDYCNPNESFYDWWFYIPDDDTLPPVFGNFTPDYVSTRVAFGVSVEICDSSSVLDIPGFEPYLLYDTDGEVEISCDTIQLRLDTCITDTLLETTCCRYYTDGYIGPYSDTTTVTVRIYAYDGDYDFCNEDDPTPGYDEWAIPVLEGPQAEPVLPLPNTITACDDQIITIHLWDPDGIEESSITLYVAGIAYNCTHTYLSYDAIAEELIFTPPAGFFSNEQTVTVGLSNVLDELGNPMRDPLSYSFQVDLESPELLLMFPDDGLMVRSTAPDIHIEISDNLAGVAPALTNLKVNGMNYNVSDAALDWSSSDNMVGNLYFLTEAAGLVFPPGDTVWLELTACDNPDYCAPNCSNALWSFTVEPDVGCYLHPNPFTPNNDPINDFAIFDYPNMFSESAELYIFNMRNIQVYHAEIGPVSSYEDFDTRWWQGYDDSGKLQTPGLYIYMIIKDGEVVCNGTVVLMR